MEWKEVRLGDIVSIKSGLAYKGAFIGKGENILLGMGCVSFKDKFLFSGARAYEADCDDKYCVDPGDIVLATRQQSDNLPILAMPAIIPSSLKAKKIIYGTNLYKVENHSEVTNDFLFWQLKTPDYIDYISSVKTGSVVRMVTKKNVEDYVFRCPPKEVRDRISKLLWGLDRKIELNNKINADLEEMAQAIFKNWFVDFEPFKDGEFVDSELGMIPEGWKVGTLDEIFSLKYGKNLSTSMILEKGDYPVYGANGIIGYYNEYNCDKYSVLVTSRGNGSGDVSRTHHPKSFITNNSFIVESLEQYKYIELPFINGLFNIIDFKSYCSGSAQPQLTNKAMRNICIISPPMEIVIKYCEMLETLFSHIECVIAENSRLSLLRDTLLPRLMSGELEVPE